MSTTKAIRRVRKAVFPVAGLGTRFLPATKAIPKELLPILDRPVLQWAVEEAREAGIEEFIFVTARGKEAIADHFDAFPALEEALATKGKDRLLGAVREATIAPGKAVYVRQDAPRGLGHAVACARAAVGDEPFALLLPDMLMHDEPGCMAGMMAHYERVGGNVIAVEEVPRRDVHKYGVVALDAARADAMRIIGMVEKPAPENAPSTLIISGRYILQPEIFAHLEATRPGAGGEIQITDAMQRGIEAGDPYHAWRYSGQTWDCGSKLGFLLANVAFGLRDPETADALRAYVHRHLCEKA